MSRPANPYPMMRPGKPRWDRESGYHDGWNAAKAEDAPRLEAADALAEACRDLTQTASLIGVQSATVLTLSWQGGVAFNIPAQAVIGIIRTLAAYDAAKKGEANG